MWSNLVNLPPNPNNRNKAKNQRVEKTLDQEGINQICEQSETISNDHLIKDHNFLYRLKFFFTNSKKPLMKWHWQESTKRLPSLHYVTG